MRYRGSRFDSVRVIRVLVRFPAYGPNATRNSPERLALAHSSSGHLIRALSAVETSSCSACHFPIHMVARAGGHKIEKNHQRYGTICIPDDAFGNWQKTYTIVYRKAVTVMVDPYSAGFCTLFKAEARVGGGVTCPNAARLLRVR